MLLKQMGDDTHHGLSSLWTSIVSVESEVLNRITDFWNLFLCIYDVFTYRIIAKCNPPKFLGRGSPCWRQSFSPLEAQEGTEGPGTQLNFSRFFLVDFP